MGNTSIGRRTRRTIIATAMVGVLSASTWIVTADRANASGEPHPCPYIGEGTPRDDGVVTDPIHHSIEPLIPALAPAVHNVSCKHLVGLDYVLGDPGGWVADIGASIQYYLDLLSGGGGS